MLEYLISAPFIDTIKNKDIYQPLTKIPSFENLPNFINEEILESKEEDDKLINKKYQWTWNEIQRNKSTTNGTSASKI